MLPPNISAAPWVPAPPTYTTFDIDSHYQLYNNIIASAGNGYARPWNNAQIGMVIGKAIENFEGVEGVIEIAVGRL